MGQPAAVVYDVSQRKVSMMLNPVDAMSVSVGQTASVHFGDQTFDAKVSFVSPVSMNNAVSLEVTLGDGTESNRLFCRCGDKNCSAKRSHYSIVCCHLCRRWTAYVKVAEDGAVKQKAIR